MKATLEAFLQSIQKLSRDELIQQLVRMKEDELNQSAILTEMRNTSTAMTREYSKIQEINRNLQAENAQLKLDNKKLCEENMQLLRKVFGRQSEKVVYMDEEPDLEDPLSEDEEENESADKPKSSETDNTQNGSENVPNNDSSENNNPPGKNTGGTGLPGPRGRGKKKPRKGMNLDNLPVDHIFDVDAAKLDALYGENNWTIISWHSQRKVERIPETDILQIKHPSLKREMTHGLAVREYRAYIVTVMVYHVCETSSGDQSNIALLFSPVGSREHSLVRIHNEHYVVLFLGYILPYKDLL